MRVTLAAVVLSLATAAPAQEATKTVQITAGNVEVTGARIAFTADGGCTLQAEFTVPPLRIEAQPRQLKAAACTAARNQATRAATLDVGVSDGGAP